MPDFLRRSPDIDRKLLEYVLAVTDSSRRWWDEVIPGSSQSRQSMFTDFRLRYQARRSVAQLYKDAKDTPFPRASNIGIGLEQVFGEYLVPLFVANTFDIEPMLQAVDDGTEAVDESLTQFHENYQRSEFIGKRNLLEHSCREILTVGGVFHKWTWGSTWKQMEIPVWVLMHPALNQPLLKLDQDTGQLMPIPVDPKMPEDQLPEIPGLGKRAKVGKIPSVDTVLLHEGPRLSVRSYEDIEFPFGTTAVDPNDWDWIADNFTVSPWWFLGRDGDPFDGKLQNLDKLWKWVGLNPADLANRPDRKLTEPIKLKEWHGKFPVTSSGKPVEIIALVATEARILLGWRLSPLPRRPFFNRQVRVRKDSPLGLGIPETIWGLRNAIDSEINQDLDSGNLYNHPPNLLSSLAMLDDEDYELMGPGTQWIVGGDVRQAATFLQSPVGRRDPLSMINWLISMTQRIWGVTDLNLSAPTQSLSPNVKTATGTMAVLNQGNIKFGHLARRLTETDTKEYQLTHEMFRAMLANPKTVSINNSPVTVSPEQREKFFRREVRIVAVGNGVTTNPTVRQQIMLQMLPIFLQHPLTANDMEIQKNFLQRLIDSMGLEMNLKDTQEIQFISLVRQLMQTPNGQARIGQAVQVSLQELQALQATQGTAKPGGNGAVVGQ